MPGASADCSASGRSPAIGAVAVRYYAEQAGLREVVSRNEGRPGLDHDTVTVRQAAIRDASGMAEVHVAAWHCAYSAILSADYLAGVTLDASRSRWLTTLAQRDPHVTNLVAERNGQIIGIASAGNARDVECERQWGEFRMLNVHPKAWGHGVGAALREQCLSELISRGYRTGYLWVVAANARAIAFYQNRGWTANGERRDDLRLQPPLSEIRLLRPLDLRLGAHRTSG